MTIDQSLLLCRHFPPLYEQLNSHARQASMATSPIEHCRRHLHIVVIIHAVISFIYFCLVLALEDDQLKWSVFVMGISQATAFSGGIITVRMWMYT